MCEINPSSKTKRVALYGGAFDPVHKAHVAVAEAARVQASLDEVVFIPAAQSPLKAHGPIGSDADRLEMLRLALVDQPNFVVDEVELKRGGVSYTLETVRDFSEKLPEVDLFWIIGADQLEQLDRWRSICELVKLVSFLTLARPGYELKPPEVAELRWLKIEAPLMYESSTVVRECLSEGKPLNGILPKRVEAFILEKGLYTSG